MKNSIRISIKTKILGLVAAAILVSVLAYLFFAIKTFTSDKMAYVYETTLANSNALSGQTREFILKSLRETSLLGATRGVNNRFGHPLAEGIFSANSNIVEFLIYKVDEKGTLGDIDLDLKNNGILSRFDLKASYFDALKKAPIPVNEIIKKGKFVFNASLNYGIPLLGVGIYNKSSSELFYALYSLEELVSLYGQNKLFKSVLLDAKNFIFVDAQNENVLVRSDWSNKSIVRKIVSENLESSVKEMTGDDEKKYLVAWAKFPELDLVELTMISKDNAYSAIKYLANKSVFFAIFLISGGILFAILVALGLTRPIAKLMEGTQEIAKGNFDVKITPSSHDEIMLLTESFNFMSAEIKRYIEEVKEKARMEKELAVAQLVQSSFYPTEHYENNVLSLHGHHSMTSECGGDWWGYHETSDKLIFYIGDATGHGVPAALITAAAHCAANLMEKIAQADPRVLNMPHLFLEWMNHAVYKAGGKILMTFFVGVIDKNTKELTYSNASHNPPLFYKKSMNPPTKDDVETLMEVQGPRLGENLEAKFEAKNLKLHSGDALFLFTDGIIEGQNPEGKAWGERRFMKSFLSHVEKDSKAIVDGAIADSTEFYQGVVVDDDVTLLAIKIK